MSELEPPDSFHLSAAIGWMDLGNPIEARNELRQISGRYRENSEVLETEWRVHAALRSWDTACEVAQRQTKVAPDHPAGWINQSYALHELKKTQEAFDELSPLVEKFPKVSVIYYNLACYACQLGDEEAAKKHLALAIKFRDKDEVKEMALADSDLKPLWEHIKSL
ncbi:MAG: tetratricopeptide repeat protein [Verrucomicrobia bacterium]|nr:tetratricopeptide repeat protein [Verrucomicrobiota bacterium]